MMLQKFNTAKELLDKLEVEEDSGRRIRTATIARQHKVRMATELAQISREITEQIKRGRASGDGTAASEWRAAQTYVDSLLSETRMWIALDDRDADTAWTSFCDAEQQAEDARRYLNGFAPAQRQLEHVVELEQILFPRQVGFFSTGLLIAEGGQRCTICDAIYGECDHLAGEIYDGEIAARRVQEIDQFLEVSLVQDPADKRCRVYDVKGIDPLTGMPSRRTVVERRKRRSTDSRKKVKRGQKHR